MGVIARIAPAVALVIAGCKSPREDASQRAVPAVVAPPAVAAAPSSPRDAMPVDAVVGPPCSPISMLKSVELGALVFAGQLAGKPIDVAIDTGANQASVSPALAASLPKVAGKHHHSTSAFRKTVTSDVISVAGLELGTHSFGTLEASVGPEDGPDLTLGIPQLEGLRATFDLRALGSLCIVPGGPLAEGHPLERVAHGLLSVPVTTHDHDLGQWLLDTGAGITVVAPSLLAALPHHDGEPLEVADGTGANGTRPTIEIEQLCVGGVCKTEQNALVLDLTGIVSKTAGVGVVGITFLRGSRLIIDLASNRWQLD